MLANLKLVLIATAMQSYLSIVPPGAPPELSLLDHKAKQESKKEVLGLDLLSSDKGVLCLGLIGGQCEYNKEDDEDFYNAIIGQIIRDRENALLLSQLNRPPYPPAFGYRRRVIRHRPLPPRFPPFVPPQPPIL